MIYIKYVSELTTSFFFLGRQLRQVVQQVEQTPVEQRQAAVGLLTTEHRVTWGPVSRVLWQRNILTLFFLDS